MDVTSKKAGSDIYHQYVSNLSYTASGGISQMKLGNGRWETAKFNTRLQGTELGLGNSATDASLWKVNYDYGELDASGAVITAKNTGNIAKQTLTVPGASFVQAYHYDSLYRLTEAKETSGATQNWIQNWSYDRYCNRTSFSKNIAGLDKNGTPAVDANTNKFNPNQGFVYDKNGNVVQDTDPVTSHNRQFIFNGDNKQTQVKDIDNGNQVVGTYFYDGEAKRVKKVTDLETTIFVYSAGMLIAEYSTKLAEHPSTNYTTTDHLGSPRIITDELGQVKARRDFLPFGEELYAGIGNRTGDNGLKYSATADSVRQKFTGYQKDSETSLDFAEARMYEHRCGRFTAVDPLLASGKSANPQTFNRYVYVGNNPIVTTDPLGLLWYQQKRGDRTYYRWSENNETFADGTSVAGWTTVDFGAFSNSSLRLDNVCGSDGCNGTAYIYRYDGNWDNGERAAAMQRPDIGCSFDPHCAGLRDPAKDATNSQAMADFSIGFPMGVENRAKSMFDVPNWNFNPALFGNTWSLNSTLGVTPWFNYRTPQNANQIAGVSAGGLALDIAVIWATGRMASSFQASESIQYTKSWPGLGLQMHREYKAAELDCGMGIEGKQPHPLPQVVLTC